MKAYEHIVDPKTGEVILREIEVVVIQESSGENMEKRIETLEGSSAEMKEALEMILSGVTE